MPGLGWCGSGNGREREARGAQAALAGWSKGVLREYLHSGRAAAVECMERCALAYARWLAALFMQVVRSDLFWHGMSICDVHLECILSEGRLAGSGLLAPGVLVEGCAGAAHHKTGTSTLQ